MKMFALGSSPVSRTILRQASVQLALTRVRRESAYQYSGGLAENW